jgi:hypothetical protein
VDIGRVVVMVVVRRRLEGEINFERAQHLIYRAKTL